MKKDLKDTFLAYMNYFVEEAEIFERLKLFYQGNSDGKKIQKDSKDK